MHRRKLTSEPSSRQLTDNVIHNIVVSRLKSAVSSPLSHAYFHADIIVSHFQFILYCRLIR